MNGRRGGRDALIEALAGQLAVHARAVRVDVAEMIRSAMRAGGYHGDYLDASHIVGVLPPTLGGVPPSGALELVDGAGVGLLDDLGLVLVDDATFAAGDHTHPGSGMSNPMTSAEDIIVGGASGTPTRKAMGANNQVLTVVAGVLTWTDQLNALGLLVRSAGLVAGHTGGVEVFFSGGTGYVSAYRRDTNAELPLVLAGSNVTVLPTGTLTLQGAVTVPGNLSVSGALTSSHHSSHEPGGSDPMAVDAAAATGSLRTLGAGATAAAAGNHAHPSYVTNPMTSVGDLIAGGASGAAGRLGVGTTDQVLAVVAGAPAWAAPASTANLLVNPGLETWQRGNGTFTSGYTADRWQILPGGSTSVQVTRFTANADTGSLACAQVSIGSFNLVASLYQKVEDYTGLRGRTITFAVRVLGFVASAARPWISNDGGATFTYGAYHSGGGAYETLTLTYAVPAGSAQLSMGVQFGANGTYYLDNATLCVGSAALAYAPLHPADEMQRCLRYYEVHGGGTAMGPIIQGYGAAGASAGYGVVFATRKAVTPTMTKNGTWTANNCSQPALNFPAPASYEFATNITALGTVGCWAADATCTVVAESNP